MEEHETNEEEKHDGYVKKEYEEGDEDVPNCDVLMVRRTLINHVK